MIKRYSALLLLCSFIAFTFLNASAAEKRGVEKSYPLKRGEELTYEITWYGILAGIGKLKVGDKTSYQGKEVYRLVSQGVSAGVIGKFYRVDDRLEVLVDPEGLYPYYAFLYQQEGSRRKTTEVFFHQEKNKITYITNKGKPREFTAPPEVLDVLSSLYFFRSQKLTANHTIPMKVFSNKKIFSAQATIVDREKLKTPLGELATLLIKPTISLNGASYKEGNAVMWLTSDERRIPVKIKIKAPIGHIIATLVDYKIAD